MANDFFKQIQSDIGEYQEMYQNNDDMKRNEWAFNYWVLDKLYNVDEEAIFDQIIDIHDKGIDCYQFDDENNTLYLMQNKYYDPELSSSVSGDYLKDLSVLPIGLLEQGKYTHSQDLQDIYTKLKRRKEYSIIFVLYITKPLDDNEQKKLYQSFQLTKNNVANIKFEICDLNEIYRKYYEDYSDGQNTNLEFELEIQDDSLILDMDNKSFDIPIKSKYIMVPVSQFYKMMATAKNKTYNLFDENIRDYLGSNGKINSKIKQTLQDGQDKRFFVYYNNGVTIVCAKIDELKQDDKHRTIKIMNPKVVNGCQTVSTIYEVIKEYLYMSETGDLSYYDEVFVMTKFLDASSLGGNKEEVTRRIVERNNSQNSIDISIFNIKRSELTRIQTELKNKGFLLCIKQSDKNTFSNTYKGAKFEELKDSAADRLTLFGLNYDKLNHFMINLDKFLQIVYCFYRNAFDAYTKKSKVIKDAKTHNEIVSYITDPSNGTIDDFLNLYLLYARAEQDRKNKKYGDDRTPIPLYLLDFIGRLECNKSLQQLSKLMEDKSKVNEYIKKYSNITRAYANTYAQQKGVDYNKMIKQKIDESILMMVNQMFSGYIA